MYIALAIDRGYLQPAAVTIESALAATAGEDHLTAFIAHSALEAEDEEWLRGKFAGRVELRFVRVRNPIVLGDNYAGSQLHINESVFLRILLPDLVPDEVLRLIYLDADTLVNGSLAELYYTDLEGAIVGAVQSRYVQCRDDDLDRILGGRPASERSGGYFNDGVMLMDVSSWRSYSVGERVRDVIERAGHRLEFMEQDALNWLLGHHWMPLSSRWNLELHQSRQDASTSKIAEYISAGSVLHFVGPRKPWKEDFPDNEFKNLYRNAAMRLGWRIC